MVVIAIPSVDILRTKTRGASLKAQLVGLLKDEISYVAAFVGVALASQGYIVADTVASLFVASVIAAGGIYLLKDNVHYLVGRAPDAQFFKELESAAKSVRGVLGVHDLKAEYVGPSVIQASLHIEVEKGSSIENADRIAHEVEERVSKEVNCRYCVIHVDPANR
jgi:cation diffusion facilitator family transporter